MDVLVVKTHDCAGGFFVSQVKYIDIQKNFYQEHPDIAALSFKEVLDLRGKLAIRASGMSPPKPIVSFAHAGLDEEIMGVITKLG